MRQSTPRVRMFAGPNGSGKSTIKEYLLPRHIGAYLNADELEKTLNQTHTLDLKIYHESLDALKLITFLKTKKKKRNQKICNLLSQEPKLLGEHHILFAIHDIDSYLAARIIDFIRLEFLSLKISFTFETVMSHISKVEFLRMAQEQGFKTYLYYVSTIDPEINIARVRYRVSTGGHAVPEPKIRDRYYRSMNLLMQAIEMSDRAFIFDNSSNGEKAAFLAEVEQANRLRINPIVTVFPVWFAERVLSEFE
ncbi:zeta toxin [Acinetobacter sp. Tr-809]|uniref:zeta toxin n=1 Tax=Acinetobacter sp. Tr-809 TaxID=2608324 RepID=UPI00141E1A96|nr:zeta toxin [Acinetobacter sp. Tr-809]NIE95098.1 zeta toxin [Acinetobacter sp. Tr-809]